MDIQSGKLAALIFHIYCLLFRLPQPTQDLNMLCLVSLAGKCTHDWARILELLPGGMLGKREREGGTGRGQRRSPLGNGVNGATYLQRSVFSPEEGTQYFKI